MSLKDELKDSANKPPSTWEQYAVRTHIYDSMVPHTLLEIFRDYQHNIKKFSDIGCGDGALLHGLKLQGLFQGKAVYGIDLSQTRLDRVKSMCPEAITILSSAESINLPTASMDLVISTQVIEHVANQELMIQELSRTLRLGGILYLTTVFKKWYGWYFYRCNGRWTMDPTHLREYQDDSELIPDVQKYGFKIIRTNKTPISYSLIDPLLRRFNLQIKDSSILAFLRRLKIPIPGYYNWEIIAEKI